MQTAYIHLYRLEVWNNWINDVKEWSSNNPKGRVQYAYRWVNVAMAILMWNRVLSALNSRRNHDRSDVERYCTSHTCGIGGAAVFTDNLSTCYFHYTRVSTKLKSIMRPNANRTYNFSIDIYSKMNYTRFPSLKPYT